MNGAANGTEAELNEVRAGAPLRSEEELEKVFQQVWSVGYIEIIKALHRSFNQMVEGRKKARNLLCILVEHIGQRSLRVKDGVEYKRSRQHLQAGHEERPDRDC